MPKSSALQSGKYLKIGQAAEILGVSIDTLRRWEKTGKIKAIRTPGGTRLYSIPTLGKINPTSVKNFQSSNLTTEELLKNNSPLNQNSQTPYPAFTAIDSVVSNEDFSNSFNSQGIDFNENRYKNSLINKLLFVTGILSVLTIVVTTWITASYLANPIETKQLSSNNNVISKLLTPFQKIAQEIIIVGFPAQAKSLGFILPEEPPPLVVNNEQLINPSVLAVTASPRFLEINADTQINGSLSVRDSINGLAIEATPSAATMAFTSGTTTFTVTKTAKLDQDVSTAASPTFSSLNLSSPSNQIVLQSGGPTGTLTWTPTTAQTITFPNATGTVVLDTATQTLTNKTISGSSNTLSNIANSALTNSSITISAGSGLSGGGAVSLGGSITLSSTVTSAISSIANSDGTLTISPTTGAVVASLNLANANTWTANQTILGNLGIGTSATGTALQVNGGSLFGWGTAGTTSLSSGAVGSFNGNVGIGTTSPLAALHVVGNTIVTGTITVGSCSGCTSLGGSVLLSDGTAAAPSLSFTNNTNAGLWRVGANLIALTTSGSAVSGIAIDGNGNVGIGTTSPNFQLQTTGNVGIGGSLTVNSAGIFNSSLAVSGLSSLGNVNASVVNATSLITTGNVGVGASITGFGNLNGLNVSGYSTLQGLSATNINSSTLTTTGNVGVGSSLTVTSAANINTLNVINNTNLNTLGVSGASNFNSTIALNNLSSFAGTALCINSSNQIVTCSGGSALTGTGVNGAVTFWNGASSLTNSAANFFWDSANNRLGIGTSAPSAAFQVNPNTFNPFVVTSAGNVGIGTTIPLQALQIVGNENLSGILQVGNAVNAAYNRIGIGNASSIGTGATAPTGANDLYVQGTLQVGTFNTPYAQTITVAKSGAEFYTINAAYTYAKTLSPSASKQILIKVMPGVYSERLTLDTSYISILGDSRDTTKMTYNGVLTTTATIYSASAITGVSIANMTIDNSAGNYPVVLTSANPTIYFSNNTLISSVNTNGGMKNDSTNAYFINNIISGDNIPVSTGTFENNDFRGCYGLEPTGGTFISNKIQCVASSNFGGSFYNNVISDAHFGYISGGTFNGDTVSGGGNAVDVGPSGTVTFNGAVINDGILTSGTTVKLYNSKVNGNITVNGGTPTINFYGASVVTGTIDPAAIVTGDYSRGSGSYTAFNVVQAGSGAAATFTGGNVGIGTTNPGTNLALAGAETINWGGGSSFAVSAGTGLAVSGNVGIGTTSPTFQLQTTGNVGIGGSLTTTGLGVFNGGINVTGLSNLGALNASTATTTSLTTSAFRLPTGANNNYIMVSDANGNGSWASSISGGFIANNSLDFQQFKDNMTLDASTNIATAGFNLTTSGTGNVAFNNTGTFTVFSPATFNSSINTNTFTSTALVFSGSGNVGIGATVAGTNLNLNPGAGGLVNIAGGVGSTGCTIDDTTGSLTCSGSIGVGSSAGQSGLWSRTGTTLSPAFSGDNVSTSGNISATGNGTITSGGTLTAQNGLTMSTGALSLISTSGTAALNLSLVTNAFNVNGNTFNIDTFNHRVGIGTSSPGAALQVNGAAAIGFGTAAVSSFPANGLVVSGNVGIGTTDTSAYNTTLTGTFFAGSASSGISISGSTISGAIGPGLIGSGEYPVTINAPGTNSTFLALQTQGINRLYIENFGNVGIGATTVNSKLSVVGNAHIGGIYQGIAAPTNGLFVDGNVGIGATTSNNKLDVWGNARITGSLTVDGAITGGSASDLRFLAGNGSAAAPAFSFSNLQNAGLWTNGDGLLLTTGGSNTSGITVTGAGNVGIGITNPGGQLNILAGNINTVPLITQLASGSFANIQQWKDGTGATAASIDWQGALTAAFANFTATNPYIKLVGGGTFSIVDGSTQTLFQTTHDKGTAIFNQRPNGAAEVALTVNGALGQTGDLQQWRVNNGIPLVVINANGNIGIGTTSPQAKLAVAGNVGIGVSFGYASAIPVNGLAVQGNVGIGTTTANSTLSLFSSSGPQVSFSNGLVNGYVGIDNGGPALDIATNNAFPVRIETNGLERLRVDSNGNIGIGLTTANSQLSIANNVHIGSLFQGITAPTNGLFVDGNVGIGTTTSSNKLDVWGNARITGSLTVDGAISGGSASDLRFLAGNGSAAAPSFSFTNLTNAGLWTNGDGLFLTTGGSNISGITVTGGGNVGIGFTSPNAKLQVNSSYSGSQSTYIYGAYYDMNLSSVTQSNSNFLTHYGLYSIVRGTVGYLGDSKAIYGEIATTGTQNNDSVAVYGYSHASGGAEGNYGVKGIANSGAFTNMGVFASVSGVGASSGGYQPSATNGNYALFGRATTTGAVNVGLYATATGGSSNYAGIFEAGNVGIGTTVPVQLFQINNNTSSPLIFTSTGNLGVGFTTPDRSLQVADDLVPTVSIAGLLGANGSQLSITGSTANGLIDKLALGIDTTNNYGYLQAGNSGSGSAFNLALNPAGGNVGIGTTSPSTLLSLYSTGSPQVSFNNGNVNGYVGIDNGGPALDIATNNAYPVRIETNGLERLRVDATGNVGVGTTSPLSTLNIAKSGGPTLTLENNSTDILAAASIGSLDFYSRDSSANLAGVVGRIQVLAATNFSSGSTPPGANTAMTFSPNTGNAGTLAEAMRINYDGTLLIGTNTQDVSKSFVTMNPSNWSSTTSDSSILDVHGTITDGTTWHGGILIQPDFEPSTAAVNELSGAKFTVQSYSTNVAGATMLGASGGVYFGSGAQTLGTAIGFKAKNYSANAASTINTSYDFYAAAPDNTGAIGSKYAFVSEANAGNVGIGTITPADKLSVVGNIMIDSGSSGNYFYNGDYSSPNIKALFNGAGDWLGLQADASNVYSFSDKGEHSNTLGGTILSLKLNGNGSGGNVGIGTTNPAYQLQTTGNVGIGGSLTLTSAGVFNSSLAVTGNTQLSTLTASGNVGLGASVSITSNLKLLGQVSCAGFSNGGKLTTDASGNVYCSADAGAASAVSGSGAAGQVTFWTSGTALSGSNNLYWDNAGGKLGIGFTTPDRSLQVAADINAVGTLASILGASGSQFSITGSTATNLNDKLAFGIDSTDHYGFIQAGTPATAYNLNLNPAGGNVGIGTTSPTATFQLASSASTTNGATFNMNSLTTGLGLYLSSASTVLSSGGLLSLDWSPAVSTLGTGDLFSINMGANALGSNLLNLKDNGSSIFSVSQTAFTTSLPTNFTSAGDVSIAYDINFTNPTASFIKSAAPISIVAGETFNSSNLTLGTYNNGQIVFDTTGGGGVVLNQYQPWTLNATSTMAWNINSSANNTLISFDTTNSRVGIGRTGPGQTLSVFGNVGIGNSFGKYSGPTNGLSVEGNIGIGTSSPTSLLSLYSSTNPQISFFNGNVNGYVGIDTGGPSLDIATNNAFPVRIETNNLERLRVDSNGNVGIGFTSPDRDFQIAADLAPTGSMAGLLGANGSQFDITGSTAGNLTDKLALGLNTTSNYGYLQAGNSGSNTAFSLLLNPAGGTVGIGTTNPAGAGTNTALTVQGSYSDIGGANGGFGSIQYIMSNNAPTQNAGGTLTFGGRTGVTGTDTWYFGGIKGAKENSSLTFAGGGNAGYLAFYTESATTTMPERMRIDSTGNIGIGTSSPSTLLSLYSAGSPQINFFNGLVKGYVGIDNGGPALDIATNNAFPVRIETNNVERLRVDSVGNVGIGTTAPTEALEIARDTDTYLNVHAITGSGQIAGIKLQRGTTDNTYTDWTIIDQAGDFSINSNGGMGTAFYIADTTKVITLSSATTIGYSVGQAVPVNGLVVAGNVGIGATTSTSNLDVWGTSRFTGNLRNDPLSGTGNRAVFSTNTGVLTNSSSDIRLKNNIQTVSDRIDVLSVLDQLRGVYFNWNQDIPEGAQYGTQEELGMIAQEVEAVLPDLVGTNATGYKSLNYSQFTGYLVEVAKAQQKEINNLIKQASGSAALANVSVDPDGTIVIPKLKVSSLELPVNDISGLNVGSNNGSLVYDSYTDLGGHTQYALNVPASLQTIDQQIAWIKQDVTTVNNSIATQSAQLASQQAQIASSSAELASASAALVSTKTKTDDLYSILTSPDILLATQSAVLKNLGVASDATVSGQLTAYNLNIQNSLKSLGQTALGSTLIAGDLTVDGTMSITGSSISTLGTLYIQNSLLAQDVDIFNGKVIVDSSGNITTQGTLTASAIKTNKLTISNTPIASGSGTLAASIGTAIIPAGTLQLPVNTTAVTAGSKIFLTATSPTGGQSLVVSYQEPSLGFVVSLDHIFNQDIKFNWWIIDSP